MKPLTKRLELLLRTVLAFPKASSRGFDCKIMSLTCCNTVTQWEQPTPPTHTTHCRKLSDLLSHCRHSLSCCLYLNFWSSAGYFGNVTHDVFGSHRLPSSTFTATTCVHEYKANKRHGQPPTQTQIRTQQTEKTDHLMMTHWFSPSIIMFLYMLSVKA